MKYYENAAESLKEISLSSFLLLIFIQIINFVFNVIHTKIKINRVPLIV